MSCDGLINFPLRVPVAESTTAFRFTKPAGFAFKAGQAVDLVLPGVVDGGEGADRHAFSIASAPFEEEILFATRMRSSPFKSALRTLQPGAAARLEGPFGSLTLHRAPDRDAAFIAGGIGITPLKGMMEYAADRRLPIRTALLYSNRSEAEIAYREEIDLTVQQNPHASVTYTLTRDAGAKWGGGRGRVDVQMLRRLAEGLREPKFYICGLPEMVRDCALMLLNELGVPRERIVAEQFWGYG